MPLQFGYSLPITHLGKLLPSQHVCAPRHIARHWELVSLEINYNDFCVNIWTAPGLVTVCVEA